MKKKRSILLLEDDPNLGFILVEHIEMNGFSVRLSSNGDEGLSLFRKTKFDLCLVDVMMPKKDGFTFVKELRARDQLTPVIFLTAKALKEDRILGFKIGADDYITKPFSMEELLLRINAVLKRSSQPEQQVTEPSEFRLGAIVFDVRKSRLMKREKQYVVLTTKEAELLAVLCRHKNSIVERETILASVWNTDSYYAARSMDVYVSKLRKYLKNEPGISIVNIHGKGYKLLVDA